MARYFGFWDFPVNFIFVQVWILAQKKQAIAMRSPVGGWRSYAAINQFFQTALGATGKAA
jgi:hypothetical protein